MSEPGYRLVYDVSQHPEGRLLAIDIALVGFVGVAAIVVLVAIHVIRTRHLRRATLVLMSTAAVLLLGALAGAVAASAAMPTTADGAAVVEGRVEHFHPMPPGRHDTERFDVSGVPFVYSRNMLSFGFNQDVVAGGPMREGLYVRIHYGAAGNYPGYVILRLEIRDDAPSN